MNLLSPVDADRPAPLVLGVRRGLLVWVAVAAVYAGLELTAVVEGLLTPVPLILVLVLARAVEGAPHARRVARWVAGVAAALCPPVAVVMWRLRLNFGEMSVALSAAVVLIAGATVALLLVPRIRALAFRPLGLDPRSAVHAVCAVTFVVVLVSSAAMFIGLQDEPGGVMPFDLRDPIVSVLGDLGLALAGVGFLMTRPWSETLARLGLRRPRLAYVVWAPVFAAAFHVVIGLMEQAESVLLPTVHALEDRFQYEFVNLPPVVGALLASLAAGVGEEIVFRGALQPRFGVLATALLFGAAHVQYQVPGMLMIFVMGLVLGVLRKRASTTFTVCVHVFYDIGAFLLPDI